MYLVTAPDSKWGVVVDRVDHPAQVAHTFPNDGSEHVFTKSKKECRCPCNPRRTVPWHGFGVIWKHKANN